MGDLAELTGAGQRIACQTHLTILAVPEGVCAMLEEDAGWKASRKFAASSALEMSLSQTNDPQQMVEKVG
jgi:hypothetical protein